MKNLITLIVCALIAFPLFSQTQAGCVSGDCNKGIGKYVYSNGDVYEGNWLDSKRSGLGKLNNTNGDTYDGMWQNDQFHGQAPIPGKMVLNIPENGKMEFRMVMVFSFSLTGTNIQGILSQTGFMEKVNIPGPTALLRKEHMKMGLLSSNS
jgi:hypothetical protein